MPEEKIPSKILSKLSKEIKMKPMVNVTMHDIIDVYEIKKNSPHIEEKKLYRIGLCSLHNDKLINRFAIKLKDFDVFTGSQTICVKEVPLTTTKTWKDYKLLQPFVKDFKPHEETTAIDIKEFIKFCKNNKITEKMLWQLLLDDTYSKGKEVLAVFYPTIIPLPYHATSFQQYNSHGILITPAKTGKSETCYRLYPQENFENISLVTLLGTNDGTSEKIGLLNGTGVFFYDEINKIQEGRFAENSHEKVLDHINTYLEKGIEQRGVRGYIIRVKGTKTVIFSGNINVVNSGARDFYYLLNKICTFSTDADKFGRRLAFFVYNEKIPEVKKDIKVDEKIIFLINTFRNEIIKDRAIQKKIINILTDSLPYVHIDDIEHKNKILSYVQIVESTAIKALLQGMSLSNDMKLKFMAVRNIINNNIFEVIQEKEAKFISKHQKKIEEEYLNLKQLLCYNQIENFTRNDEILTKKINQYLTKNNLDISQQLSQQQIITLAKELNTSQLTILGILSKIKKDKQTNERNS